MDVNDNVWCWAESVCVTVSADPVEGSRWGALMVLLSQGSPWLCDPIAASYWNQCNWWSFPQQGALEDQGRIFLKTSHLISEQDNLLNYCFGQPKLNSL